MGSREGSCRLNLLPPSPSSPLVLYCGTGIGKTLLFMVGEELQAMFGVPSAVSLPKQRADTIPDWRGLGEVDMDLGREGAETSGWFFSIIFL